MSSYSGFLKLEFNELRSKEFGFTEILQIAVLFLSETLCSFILD